MHVFSKWLDPKEEVSEKDLVPLGAATNPGMLAGVVVLDLLLGHTDRKPLNTNLILHREGNRHHLKLIDLSMAFGSATWELGNLLETHLPPLGAPLPYAHPPESLLNTVHWLTDFTPYLDKLPLLTPARLEEIVAKVPAEWGVNDAERAALVKYIRAKAALLPEYLAKRTANSTKKWWQ